MLYSTPPKRFLATRSKVDAEANPRDHYLFYLEGVREASIEIQEIIANGKKVVCDRYWLTTYVYHHVMCLDVDRSDFNNIARPDLTVFLAVGCEVQAQRFLLRGMSAGDRRMLDHQQALAREYVRELKLFPSNAIVHMGTDDLTPEQVVDQIEAWLVSA